MAGVAGAGGRRGGLAGGVADAAFARGARAWVAWAEGSTVSGARGLVLSELDVRVLRATDARYERSPEKVGELAGCVADVDVALEHAQ